MRLSVHVRMSSPVCYYGSPWISAKECVDVCVGVFLCVGTCVSAGVRVCVGGWLCMCQYLCECVGDCVCVCVWLCAPPAHPAPRPIRTGPSLSVTLSKVLVSLGHQDVERKKLVLMSAHYQKGLIPK